MEEGVGYSGPNTGYSTEWPISPDSCGAGSEQSTRGRKVAQTVVDPHRLAQHGHDRLIVAPLAGDEVLVVTTVSHCLSRCGCSPRGLVRVPL